MRRLFRIADWPFTVKLGVAPAVAVGLLIILAVNGTRGIAGQSSSVANIVQVSVEGTALLADAQNGVQMINGGLYRVLALQAAKVPALNAEAELAELNAQIDLVVAKLEAFRRRFATPEQKPQLAKLIEDIRNYKGAIDWVSQMLEIDFVSAVSFLEPFDRNFRALSNTIDDFVAAGGALSQNNAAAAFAAGSAIQKSFLWTTILAVVLVVAFATLIVQRTNKSIRSIAFATRRLADGDTSIDIKALTRRDELGAIVVSLEVFAANLEKVAMLQAEQVALKHRADAERRTALLDLALVFHGSVRDVVAAVAAGAGEVQASATTLLSTAESTSQ